MTPPPDKDLVILYVEDFDHLRLPLMEYIRGRYSERSRGAGTRAAAEALLDAGFAPGLVLFDASIPDKEGEAEGLVPGNLLYARLVVEGVPVVVLSSRSEELSTEDPYLSDPPLGFVEKFPLDRDKIDQAVAVYFANRPG